MASTIYTNKKNVIEQNRKRKQDEADAYFRQRRADSEKDGGASVVSLCMGAVLLTGPGIAIAIIVCVLVGIYCGIPVMIAIIVLYATIAFGLKAIDALRKEKRANQVCRQEMENRQKKYEQIEKEYNQEVMQLDNWYKAYQADVKKMAEQYFNGQVVSSLATQMQSQFKQMIEDKEYNYTINIVNVDYSYSVFPEQITCPNRTISFEIERINSLQNSIQCEALANALARTIKMYILQHRPNATIKIEHDDADVTIHYSGVNPHFIPKKNI